MSRPVLAPTTTYGARLAACEMLLHQWTPGNGMWPDLPWLDDYLRELATLSGRLHSGAVPITFTGWRHWAECLIELEGAITVRGQRYTTRRVINPWQVVPTGAVALDGLVNEIIRALRQGVPR